jgi:hypothetical protein
MSIMHDLLVGFLKVSKCYHTDFVLVLFFNFFIFYFFNALIACISELHSFYAAPSLGKKYIYMASAPAVT